jgi:hypothetical protein
MPAVGIEPTRGYPQRILSPERLPLRHVHEIHTYQRTSRLASDPTTRTALGAGGNEGVGDIVRFSFSLGFHYD